MSLSPVNFHVCQDGKVFSKIVAELYMRTAASFTIVKVPEKNDIWVGNHLVPTTSLFRQWVLNVDYWNTYKLQ